MENDYQPNGWPLGLGIVNMRLRAEDSVPAAASLAESYYVNVPSSSFSSFSSSNLDTESTASFFQDQSVSLGRLIGIKPKDNKGRLHFPHSIRYQERNRLPRGVSHSDVSRGHVVDMSPGICAPLLLGALVKINRIKAKTKR